MSRDHSKQRRNEHLLKNLPTEVLLKARSTLFSLSGALKPKHEQQRPKLTKQELKEEKNHERLKSSRSEPEFSEVRKKHRSRIDDGVNREYVSGARPRPMSVGTGKQYDKELEDFRCGSFSRDVSPMPQRNFDPTEEVCLQSRLVIPVAERLSSQDVHMQDVNERPRKKLSFREPEIVISSDRNGSVTLGRSHKLMGVNSLTRRPNRVSLRSEPISSSLDGVDSDLESQAMRIVRTVGQAFEVCHKMQVNSPEQPAPSTSSAADEPAPSVSDNAVSKEAASDCGGSEAAAPASTTKVIVEEGAVGGKEEPARPSHLDLLPPPPRKEGKRNVQRTIPPPSINLPDLPECVTKVDVPAETATDANTPLSAQHQLQLLRERLDQQAQQTRAAVAQLLLLRDQLAAEQAARCEAQARTHQLLVHNKELLEHIAALVAHLQDRERGNARPISAQQLTLLPQKAEASVNNANKIDHHFATSNGNRTPGGDAMIDLFPHTGNHSVENNNNSRLSPFSVSPAPELVNGISSAPCFGGMSNDEIQNYLISKFQDMGGFAEDTTSPKKFNANQQFYQNCNAFPNIPPLTNHYSATDLTGVFVRGAYKEPCSSADNLAPLVQAMSVGHSENSLFSNSQETSSKDSTPDELSSDEGGIPFIMPLSHNGTLTATGEDGRVRLIVPVSPSESTSEVGEPARDTGHMGHTGHTGHTLQVPGADRLTAPAAPITRTTSEKVPNRSEMMTALRSQWTRHTTK